jgi:hypothetical protein
MIKKRPGRKTGLFVWSRCLVIARSVSSDPPSLAMRAMAGLESAEAPLRVGGSNPILSPRGAHGLLRGACHRARIRETRWLAMTVELSRIALRSIRATRLWLMAPGCRNYHLKTAHALDCGMRTRTLGIGRRDVSASVVILFQETCEFVPIEPAPACAQASEEFEFAVRENRHGNARMPSGRPP